MEDFKEIIANVIVESLEHDLLDIKYDLNLDSNNYLGHLKSDVINTKLKKAFSSKRYVIHKFKRYAWEGRFILDLESKSLVSITSVSNLNKVSNDKTRKVPHYMESILKCLNSKIHDYQQISLDVGDSFDLEVYDRDFSAIFQGLDLDLKEYTYYVVTYDYQFNKIVEMNWYLLGSEFNIAEKTSMMDLINPDFIDLTSSENETEPLPIKENSVAKRGIQLGLKEQAIRKQV